MWLLHLIFFIYHKVFKVSFHGWATFHCVDVPCFLCSFISRWLFGWFHILPKLLGMMLLRASRQPWTLEVYCSACISVGWGGHGFFTCHQLAFRLHLLLRNRPPRPHSGFSGNNIRAHLWGHLLPADGPSRRREAWETAWELTALFVVTLGL